MLETCRKLQQMFGDLCIFQSIGFIGMNEFMVNLSSGNDFYFGDLGKLVEFDSSSSSELFRNRYKIAET